MSSRQKRFKARTSSWASGRRQRLEPLEQFFQAVPVDSGMAFVVVQHLARLPSLAGELLYGTRLDIHRVEDRMRVEADVYLIPPRITW